MALTVLTPTIPAGQSLSNALDCSGQGPRIVRIGCPTSWTAAALSFQIAPLPTYDTPPGDAGYLNVFHVSMSTSGTWQPYEVTLKVVAGSALLMPAGFGSSISWLRLRSGSSSKPVAQAADATFVLVFDS